MVIKDYRSHWWLLTEHHHQVMFYGDGPSPTDHHVGNSTGIVRARLRDGSDSEFYVQTQSGSVYLLDWKKHRINLANLLIDRAFLAQLGVVFPGDDV